ncbi:guanylate kinase [Patescibacteria group bacterium]|nr:guanylate kinase [Patescibacteria group bacterium]MBU1673030.1 guanylate kinase [Patescibacteria group bacterium]MBU1963299.1 guanylate kinase [Patescibacteria group bacterium]
MGKLFIITGPSGAGKDSVIFRAKEQGLEFAQVITTSTREIRAGESEGHPYHFVAEEEFKKMKDSDGMIEWAEVYGNLYGSSKKEVEDKLSENDMVVVKVDPQGARTFKKMMPEAVSIFIMPPSYEYLEKRLVNRETDSKEVIKERLETARKELENLLDWDFLVVNEEGKLDEAAAEVKEIVENSK